MYLLLCPIISVSFYLLLSNLPLSPFSLHPLFTANLCHLLIIYHHFFPPFSHNSRRFKSSRYQLPILSVRGLSQRSSCLLLCRLHRTLWLCVLTAAADARQWDGNRLRRSPGVKTWRTYHNTVSKPRASLLRPSADGELSVSCCRSLLLPCTLARPPCGYSCVCCVCDSKLCLPRGFSPHRQHCPTHQPLLTSDLGSSTCPHTHTLFTPLALLALSSSDVKHLSVLLIDRYNSPSAYGTGAASDNGAFLLLCRSPIASR